MRIVLPLDGSRIAEAALPHGRALARAFHAETVLLRVVATDRAEPDRVTNVLDWQLRCRHAEGYLSRICGCLKLDDCRVTTVVSEGRAAEEIVRYANSRDVDVAVLSAGGEGGLGAVQLGGTASKVLAGLRTSVLLVPPSPRDAAEAEQAYRLILVPADGSPGSGWAARIAAAIAIACGAKLLLARIVPATELPGSAGYSRETRRLAERLTQAARLEAAESLRLLRSQLPPELDVEMRIVVAPSVSRAINDLAEARQADLMVASAHGFDREMQWRYGPVTERLLAHAKRPILVLQYDAAASGRVDLSGESGRWRISSVA